MIAELGIITTGLALVAAAYGMVVALAGGFLRRDKWVVSARNAASPLSRTSLRMALTPATVSALAATAGRCSTSARSLADSEFQL